MQTGGCFLPIVYYFFLLKVRRSHSRNTLLFRKMSINISQKNRYVLVMFPVGYRWKNVEHYRPTDLFSPGANRRNVNFIVGAKIKCLHSAIESQRERGREEEWIYSDREMMMRAEIRGSLSNPAAAADSREFRGLTETEEATCSSSSSSLLVLLFFSLSLNRM